MCLLPCRGKEAQGHNAGPLVATDPKSRFSQRNRISIPHYPRAIDRPNQNVQDMPVQRPAHRNRMNGGRHERAFHILRHLGSAPEPSADIWLARGSAALAKVGRLAVRSISARTPLHARARTKMARKTWPAMRASIGGALLTRADQRRPSHAQSNVINTPTSGDHP
jgi:hypothetical protein